MKKFLLFLFAMLTGAIGAWADGDGYTLSGDSWYGNVPATTEYAAVVNLTKPGVLDNAIAEINTQGKTFDLNGTHNYSECKIIYIEGSINDADLEALSSLNFETVDLQNVTWAATSKTFTNTTVKNLILPDGWSKEEVNAIGAAIGADNNDFGSALSQKLNGDASLGASLIAYVNKGNSLAVAMSHTFLDSKPNKKIGETVNGANQNNLSFKNIKSLTVSGNAVARDWSGAYGLAFTTDGHMIFDKPADETSDVPYAAVGGGTRVLTGTTTVRGAIYGAAVTYLDLRDVKIDDVYCDDLNLNIATILDDKNPVEVWIPNEESGLKTIPADFGQNSIKELCIPSNIEVIRTRALPSCDHIWTTGYKVGETGGDPKEMTYDNGCYASQADEVNPKVKPQTGFTKLHFASDGKYPYGTYTFSSNLKLIESRAFSNTEPHVKDVYVLAKTAPECHVDAFNTKMYVGNTGFNPNIVGGVITRDSYSNGDAWITMLHYPRECETPQVQRYTDPTRQYTVASNEVDGKGGVIYYPMQGEFINAYAQGTSGYLWNAWERTYKWGMIQNELNFGTDGWSAAHQKEANDKFLANPDLAAYPGDTKYTCSSFYDVTANGQYSQPAGLVPYYDVRWNESVLSDKGDGAQLYPAIEVSNTTEKRYVVATAEDIEDPKITVYSYDSETKEYTPFSGTPVSGTTYYKAIQKQDTNQDGTPKFETCDDGDYVQDTRYVEAENGGFVRVRTTRGYDTTNKAIEGVEVYYSDNQGQNQVIPSVANGMYWYENGTQPVFSNPVYAPVSGVTTYYTESNGVYTETTPQLNGSYYYKTGNKTNVFSSAVKRPVENVSTYYYYNSGTMTQENPQFGTIYYYKDGTTTRDVYVTVNNYDPVVLGQTYYTSNDGSKVVVTNPELNGTYYYKTGNTVDKGWVETYYYGDNTKDYYTYDGSQYVKVSDPQYNVQYWSYSTEKVDETLSTTTLVDNVNQYYDQNGKTTNVFFTQTYYYISGTETVDNYVGVTELQNNVNTYYSFGWHTENGKSVEGYYEFTGDLFSKEYYYVTGQTDEYLQATTYDPSQTYYTSDNGSYTVANNILFNGLYYYVTGTTAKYDSADGLAWNAHTYYTDAAGSTEATEVTFDQSYYYPIYSDSYEAYTDADGDDTQYKSETYYRKATSADGSAQRYCPVMVDMKFPVVTKQNDYRGWHQFVLSAYSKGTDIPMQPMRSYQTDNDWWTLCLPYDLTYKEVMLLYGDVSTGTPNPNKVPIVCLLSNVVHDNEAKHIRLNFSSNLMLNTATKVDGEWTVTSTKPGETDVVIHAGVPYVIKPTFEAGAGRQFDVYGRDEVNEALSRGRITATTENYPGLYEKLKAAVNVAGDDFRKMQEDNLYTVPCLLPVDQAGNDKVDDTEITYDGKKYYRSKSWDYTFVGALQKNIIPPFSYFLGYKGSSLFVYADYDTSEFENHKTNVTPDYRNLYKWTNNACVICPNLLGSGCKETQKGSNNKYNLMLGSHKGLITEATKTAPARWMIYSENATIGSMRMLKDDRYADDPASSRGILSLGDEINYGYDMEYSVVDGIETVDVENQAASSAERKVYSLNGQYMGNSQKNLKKGVYIVGGKKYVVK